MLIKDFPNYDISSDGVVTNVTTGRVLEEQFTDKGYCSVNLCRRGKQKRIFVHRLVALHFIPNPDNLPFVSHYGKRTDNSVENLRWINRKKKLTL